MVQHCHVRVAIFHSFSLKIRHHATITLQQKQKLAPNLGLEMKNVYRNYKYNLNQTRDSEVTISNKRVKAICWHTWKMISGHANFWFKKTAKKLLTKYQDTSLTGHDTASPCKSYQLFKGTCCPYLQGFKVHDPLTQHHTPKPQNPWSNDCENPKTHNKTFTHG